MLKSGNYEKGVRKIVTAAVRIASAQGDTFLSGEGGTFFIARYTLCVL